MMISSPVTFSYFIIRTKKLCLPGHGSLQELGDALDVKEPRDLAHFLHRFSIFWGAIGGDLQAIERISYEFVEDQALDSVLYCETRFCPHLLLPPSLAEGIPDKEKGKLEEDEDKEGVMTAEDVLKYVLRGLKKGEEAFGTKVRVILSCIRGHPNWSWELLKFCEEYRDNGVVGIDIAGIEDSANELLNVDDDHIAVFTEAKEKRIHRTVHAGECSPHASVKQAIEVLHAERIGHGYTTVYSEDLMHLCKEKNIHFETCPHSSFLTGAMKMIHADRHPLMKFSEEGMSFSINTDDPTITNTTLEKEYALLRLWGFNEGNFCRANFEAALHSFLPLPEKEELINNLKDAYGIVEYSLRLLPEALLNPQDEEKPAVTIASWGDRT